MVIPVPVPDSLKQIPQPPKQLFHKGSLLNELLSRPRVAIVGSRNVSPYGRQVTAQLAEKLAERGIVIISGLALGIDGISHQAALDAGGLTIAVLPTPVDKVYPRTHRTLASKIVASGGALVSEYSMENFTIPYAGNFIARNRLIAGLAQVVLITEAAEKSGSLHTARFAIEQGKDVLAVPGDINRPNSVGTNNLIKSGAMPVTSYLDVLHALKLEEDDSKSKKVKGRNQHEQQVLDLLVSGVNDGQELLKDSSLTSSEFNQAIVMLEIGGKIRSLGANHWSLH